MTSGGSPPSEGNAACNALTRRSSTDCWVAWATRCTGYRTSSGNVNVMVRGTLQPHVIDIEKQVTTIGLAYMALAMGKYGRGNLGCGFRHRRRWILLNVSFKPGAVGGQLTLRTIMIDTLQRFDPTRHIRLEIALKTRFGHAIQSQALTIAYPLAPQGEGFHAHLCPRIGILKPPIPQRGD